MPLSVVTGAGLRVGRAVVAALADAGYDVVCCAHRSVAGAEEAARAVAAVGRRAFVEQADLSDPAAVDALAGRIRAAHPVVDVLVHNAGRFEAVPFERLTREQWRAMQAVNVEAPLFLTQRLLPALQAAADPLVVHITDIAADRPMKHHAHYNCSKAALSMLTKSLAVDLGPQIRVCAVAPGTVAFPPDYDEEKKRRIVARIPLARTGTPADIGQAVVFLARASYLSGITIPVDGGRGVVL